MRLHREDAQQGRNSCAGCRIETGRGVPRAEAGYDHAMRAELVMQSLAKREHISLGRRIGRVAWDGLEGQETGDEKNMSRSPRGHVAAE